MLWHRSGLPAGQFFPLTLTWFSPLALIIIVIIKSLPRAWTQTLQLQDSLPTPLCYLINSAAIEESSVCVCPFVNLWDWQLCVWACKSESAKEREKQEQTVYYGVLVCRLWFIANSCFPSTQLQTWSGWLGAEEFLPIICWDSMINPAALLTDCTFISIDLVLEL